ncbi:unnamed protein product, partial [marine sediment metagenome]
RYGAKTFFRLYLKGVVEKIKKLYFKKVNVKNET